MIAKHERQYSLTQISLEMIKGKNSLAGALLTVSTVPNPDSTTAGPGLGAFTLDDTTE
jgi:hypothetical protein